VTLRPFFARTMSGSVVTHQPSRNLQRRNRPRERRRLKPVEPSPRRNLQPKRQTPTPEALAAFMDQAPDFKATLEANPQIKGALFSMSKKLAVAEPIAQLFAGSVDAAKFAEQASRTMVDVRSGFLEAAESGSIENAFQRFAEEFQERDEKGNPRVDAAGNPVYGDDFHMMNDYVVDTYHSIEIADLEASLNANQFASEEAREAADMALQAFKYIQDYKSGKIGEHKPDLSKLDPDTKAFYEKKEAELAERENKLNGEKKNQTVQEKQAERANFEQGVARKVGGTVGKRLSDMIAAKEAAGVFIPGYVMEAKDPGTGIPMFAKNLLDKFEEATYGRYDKGATEGHRRRRPTSVTVLAMLARRPPSPEAEQDRVNFALQLLDNHLA
jgi:hypothetical protein